MEAVDNEFKVEKLDNVWQIILECLKTSLRAFKVNNLARSFLPRMCNLFSWL